MIIVTFMTLNKVDKTLQNDREHRKLDARDYILLIVPLYVVKQAITIAHCLNIENIKNAPIRTSEFKFSTIFERFNLEVLYVAYVT